MGFTLFIPSSALHLPSEEQCFISVNLCLDDLTVSHLPSFLTHLGQVLAGDLDTMPGEGS